MIINRLSKNNKKNKKKKDCYSDIYLSLGILSHGRLQPFSGFLSFFFFFLIQNFIFFIFSLAYSEKDNKDNCHNQEGTS